MNFQQSYFYFNCALAIANCDLAGCNNPVQFSNASWLLDLSYFSDIRFKFNFA